MLDLFGFILPDFLRKKSGWFRETPFRGGHTGTKKFYSKHPGQKTQSLQKQKARVQKAKVKRNRHQKQLKAVA